MNYPEILAKIKTFIFDVDGVLTDGKVYLDSNGAQNRSMNIKDGYALQLAVKLGYEIIIISGGKSESVRTRLKGLGIHHIYLGSSDKEDVFEEVKMTLSVDPESTLYMGDDIPDFPVMSLVGLPSCPKDAAPEIQEISKYISDKNGGEGCVRDVIEKVLRAQDNWFGQNDDRKVVQW